jgi:hypothetical protein
MKYSILPLLIFFCFIAGCGGGGGGSSDQDAWTDEGVFLSPQNFTLGRIVADVSIITLESGSYRMFFNLARTNGLSGLYSSISTNETTWTTEEGEKLADVSVSRPFQISPEGYRLYYNGRENGSILSAISTNEGRSWIAEAGTRIATDSSYAVVDMGTTLLFPNNLYRMYYGASSEGGAIINFVILSATSEDGVNFTREGVRLISSTGRATHPHVFKYNNQYIMYYSTHNYVYKAVSSDGLNWTEQGSVGINGADPFIQQLSNGSWRMYYGTYDAGLDRGYVRTALWKR